jgi:hypothetical protein
MIYWHTEKDVWHLGKEGVKSRALLWPDLADFSFHTRVTLFYFKGWTL